MSRPRISRRFFLRLALLTGIGAGIAIIEHNTQPVGAITYLRWMLRGQLQRLKTPSVVALGECHSYSDDVLGCLRGLWQEAEMPDVKGKRVLVKPNLIDVIDHYPVTTAPEVIAGVLDILIELGAGEITVGGGSFFRREMGPIVEKIGLGSVLNSRGVPFVDLNYDDPQPVEVRDGWLRRSQRLWLPHHARQADLIISVPKLKTHHWSGVTISMKNLFGIVPSSRYGWPKNMLHINGIPASIIGVYQSLPPVVAVVDGIVGMEGDGPLFGTPVQHGLLAVGRDPLAVDIICTRLMGFSPESIIYLDAASWAGVGLSARIETRGAPMERLQRQYKPPPSFFD